MSKSWQVGAVPARGGARRAALRAPGPGGVLEAGVFHLPGPLPHLPPPCGSSQFSFLCSREAVRSIVLKKFAGPYDKGEYSPSVQKTLYDIQVLSLSQLPEVRFVTCHSED